MFVCTLYRSWYKVVVFNAHLNQHYTFSHPPKNVLQTPDTFLLTGMRNTAKLASMYQCPCGGHVWLMGLRRYAGHVGKKGLGLRQGGVGRGGSVSLHAGGFLNGRPGRHARQRSHAPPPHRPGCIVSPSTSSLPVKRMVWLASPTYRVGRCAGKKKEHI